MRDYAVFRLYGPMASWGEIAVGEIRDTAVRPTRSALIGLLGAALGIRRDDEESCRGMVEAYRFAVRTNGSLTPIRDFHTWQRPKQKRGLRWETRKEELEAETIDTGLSRRGYLCDAVWTVCMWTVTDDPPCSLEEIRQAVRTPRFVLYLGRKSCPPGLPVSVEIVTAETVKDAFDRFDEGSKDPMIKDLLKGAPLYFWDDDPNIGMEALEKYTRRDVPLNRRAWQFTERYEHRGGPGIVKEE
jgi:CRISPR system Cascade subunit CasD